ncbi:hypothetical protein EOA16_27245 [Mesorhizobium sp. M7A.F.Ca.US.008.03.1.1]|nr:hypothetical protein EOA16_27245 [Mesorhizobium sp. M7A.F.Ca.US.008.03.1.1]
MTPTGTPVTVNPIAKPLMAKPTDIQSPRLTVRSDEAVKRRIADTDGTVRRARHVAETNRLI